MLRVRGRISSSSHLLAVLELELYSSLIVIAFLVQQLGLVLLVGPAWGGLICELLQYSAPRRATARGGEALGVA